MASVVVFTYRTRGAAVALADLLRACGIPAAAVPEEVGRALGRMAWAVRVPEADAGRARKIMRALMHR